MPSNFQFTFLGCQHNYVARVTTISNDGVPRDASLTRTYGLPVAFADKMIDKQHQKRFFYNFRGHDFLSYSGQFRGKRGIDDVGHVNTAFVPISESSLLESLRRKNEQKGTLGLNMVICLGPRPGSVFVDAYKLKRYKWENLPPSLNLELQDILMNGYERCGIEDVQMNALGGWVILLHGGKDFVFGGELPYELRILLQDTKRSKIEKPKLDTSIYRIYLNHQHPEEYVLIFGDGQCFVKLHSDFEEDIRFLLAAWNKKTRHPKFNVRFISSSTTSEASQQVLNAAYYSRRGLFFLSRLNEEQALLYLREAADLDRTSVQIRENYCMAIIGRLSAMRRKREPDLDLERQIQNRPVRTHAHRPPPPRMNQDEPTFFRAEYMWMLEEQDISISALTQRLDALQRPFLDGKWNLADQRGGNEFEWSYEKAIKGDEDSHRFEMDTEGVVRRDPNAPVEAPAEEVVVVDRTVTRTSELSSSVDEFERIKEVVTGGPVRDRIVLNPPEFGKPPRFFGWLASDKRVRD